MSLGDFIAACRKRLPAEPAWTSAEEAIGARRPFERSVPLEGERSFSLRARPISGSAVMISIDLDTAPAPAGSQTLPA